jgi:hypothetical protein
LQYVATSECTAIATGHSKVIADINKAVGVHCCLNCSRSRLATFTAAQKGSAWFGSTGLGPVAQITASAVMFRPARVVYTPRTSSLVTTRSAIQHDVNTKFGELPVNELVLVRVLVHTLQKVAASVQSRDL